MSGDNLRYRCIEEDDGTLTVWDDSLNAPACLAGQELSHRPRQRAETACSILNRIENADFERRIG